jgi:ribonuclease Z
MSNTLDAPQPVRVILLGTGTPAPLAERQSAALVVDTGRSRLVFDAGRAVTTQLARVGIPLAGIQDIFLTHHNYDHICGLGDLLLSAWHAGAPAVRLAGPHGTDTIVQALFEQVYAREIAFTQRLQQVLGEPFQLPADVVRVTTIMPGDVIHGDGWSVTAAAVDHGRGLGLRYEEWPCLAYAVETRGKRIVISGDTIMCAEIVALARSADLLVQCCHRSELAIMSPAQRLIDEKVFASARQAGEIAARAGVKTLLLTHLSPMTAEELAGVLDDVRCVWNGNVILGEDLLSVEV